MSRVTYFIHSYTHQHHSHPYKLHLYTFELWWNRKYNLHCSLIAKQILGLLHVFSLQLNIEIPQSHMLFPRNMAIWVNLIYAVMWILVPMDIWFLSEGAGLKHCWTIHRFRSWYVFIEHRIQIWLSHIFTFLWKCFLILSWTVKVFKESFPPAVNVTVFKNLLHWLQG